MSSLMPCKAANSSTRCSASPGLDTCRACRTLPSNLALCVNPGFDYVKVKDPASGRVYIVADCRLGELPGAVPKEGKKGKEATPGFQVCTKSGQTGTPRLAQKQSWACVWRVCVGAQGWGRAGLPTCRALYFEQRLDWESCMIHTAPGWHEGWQEPCLASAGCRWAAAACLAPLLISCMPGMTTELAEIGAPSSHTCLAPWHWPTPRATALPEIVLRGALLCGTWAWCTFFFLFFPPSRYKVRVHSSACPTIAAVRSWGAWTRSSRPPSPCQAPKRPRPGCHGTLPETEAKEHPTRSCPSAGAGQDEGGGAAGAHLPAPVPLLCPPQAGPASPERARKWLPPVWALQASGDT